ncbi:helix-turn-helix domain-containing protein [Desertihabitans brevis]|uniref:Helix-turn-helix domain-containing protein n=1 Tax=Desertihabitans brevis TaxID=2268447 RepID=A0A367Z005_9ACTN|nr:helix-turn-helix domain-containing protein [Desertihabitans brevis]RCK71486.1 helix-turn-helix domain-containing protein [Desertihabitans brevis]
MEDPAVSFETPAVELPPPAVRRVSAGEFSEGVRYHVRRSRGTDDWLLLHTVDGAGLLLTADDRQMAVGADQAVLVRPGTVQEYGTDPAAGRWELLWTHFRPPPTWVALLDWPEVATGVGHLRLGAEVAERVRRALLDAARASRMAVGRPELFAQNALEAALLWYDTQNPRQRLLDERVLRVLEHIDAHLAEDLDVQDLARVAHLSASRLSHLFSAQVGSPPLRHLDAQRMELAAELLELTSQPVAEVARRVGYGDPLYFSTRFRRRHGVSPTRYRRERRGQQQERPIG